LFQTGYEFETPIPEITPEGAKPYPPTGYRTMDARTWFFYGITGITPVMATRVTGIGSQYLIAMADACSAAIWIGTRIASPEMFPEAEMLPHLICSRPMFIGGATDEADQHGGAGRIGGSDSRAVCAGRPG
jgi:hypothetical protein